MEFLSVGEKLKKLRKQLNMKQEDLADTNITRAFISMIEIGKRSLNRDSSLVLINKFRVKASALGIELDVDDLYLTRNAIEDAELYCIQKLQNINSIPDIKEIVQIGNIYKLGSVLALAYTQLGDTIFEERDYIGAFTSYVSALEYYRNLGITDKYPYLYNMMGRCKISQLQFTEALTYFNFADHHALLQNNQSIRNRVIYNIAVCNKKLGRIEECIKYIDIYLSICDREQDFSVYIYANILKSTCYEANNLFDKSIDLLKGLLKNFNSISEPLLGLIYNNLGILYFKEKMFDRSLEYFDISEKIRASIDKPNLSHTVIEKASIYIEQCLYEQAISILRYGLDLATEHNDIEYQLKAYHALADIYMNLDCYKDAENLYLESLILLENNEFKNYKDEFMNIYIKLSSFYIEQNNIDRLKEILSVLKNSWNVTKL